MTEHQRAVHLPADLHSVRVGRQLARDIVNGWGLERLVDDVQLGVSELLSNAVRHAGTDVVLTLSLSNRLTVEVLDNDPDLPHPAIPDPDLRATSGRGLRIVSAISADWGVRAAPGGKTVWFALPLPESGTPDADILSFADHRDEHPVADYDIDAAEARQMQARAAV